MAFVKKILKSRPVTKVRFKLHPHTAEGCKAVYLVGSFNSWNESSMPMKKNKDGSFALELELAQGARHLFRYLRSDGVWLNDEAADGYETCSYSGAENSVLQI
ncbi:isoamylase early set domain-containing protein [Desulfovibrio sp. OttesenSCG-928-F07]|nr:isoamylase early set domain-containing protein [Desulfovibrio sp. OttesenSCG-928-F07]